LLPLTRYFPSGDHAIQSTQFLCPAYNVNSYNAIYASLKLQKHFETIEIDINLRKDKE